jgi:CRISPR-associated endonuclease/helicase Cas3
MDAYDPLVLQFWGKTPRPGDPPEQFHPAIFHMLDVACVAEALLRDGPPRLRSALLHAWRGCDPDALLAWLPFLIATHDLGKISAAFQGQVDAQRERLIGAGVTFKHLPKDLYHATISACWLHHELSAREAGVAHRLVWAIRDAMGGHHGRFAEGEMRTIRQRLAASERGEPRWALWREQTYALLRHLLAPPGELAALGAPQRLRPATVALTGFIVWADWMGSNERDFPATPGLTPEAYLDHARRRAAAALETHQLRAARPLPAYTSYTALFPGFSPRPLQEQIDQIAPEWLATPILALIEAPTGEGKTEAALALARRIAAARGLDEIFFALPTMATGNQMFTRLETFYRSLYGASGAVRLTHSQAIVVEEDLRRVMLAGDHDQADPDGASGAAALDWFAGTKKAMLAPFGVGTVDQVELGGLNVRHYALRLLGLAGKVVVIDEIHAYDAYMSTILDHTLSWLAGLGCSVVLLSATLPTARHQALAAAFLQGLGQTTPPVLPDPMPYPALSLYTADQATHTPTGVFRDAQQFTLRMTSQRTAADEAAYLIDLVRSGGAVARLCNRVDDAQMLYQELQRQLPADAAQRVLLHARFPLRERQRREQRITNLVGKETQRTPDQALIIVGTQVLEQSLDYDVDVMVSDFAPIDLLLQRAGRLHRHDRQGRRPLQHAAPVLEVTLPYDQSGAPDWQRWAPIYTPYILWRTWEVLRADMDGDERTIVLPRDYRPLIEAVYRADDVPTGPHAAAITQALERYRRENDEQQAQARRPLVPPVMGNDAIVENGGRPFIDDEAGAATSWQLAKTRLGDRVSLVPVYRVNDTVSLHANGAFPISTDAEPTLEQQKALIEHAVPVSDRQVIATYRDERRARELQWPWRKAPALLRALHPLLLDPQTHTATLNGRRLRLDADLGLVIEKLDARRHAYEEDL